MRTVEQHFENLTREEILAIRPGNWNDYELLSLQQRFQQDREWDRAAAVIELILRSPEHSEAIAYDELYFELVEYCRHTKKDSLSALRWAYAALAYAEQHEPGLNRFNFWRDVATTYLRADEFDTSLSMFARILRADPTDIWTYNTLGIELRFAGLHSLGVEVLDRALEMVRYHDPEGLTDQLTKLREEALQKAQDEVDATEQVSSDVLADFRSALADGRPREPAGLKRERFGAVTAQPYMPPVDRLLALGQAEDDAVYDEILQQGKVLAPELIRMAFDPALHELDDDEPGHAGPVHAVALLRRLRDVVELDELASWLDQADGDWYHELLSDSCGKIGGYTTEQLQAMAADTTYNVSVRGSITAALAERANRLPDQSEQIIEFMRHLLNRPEAYDLAEEETFVGFLIADILDMTEGQALLPDIQRAFEEDRVDTEIVGLGDIHREWHLKPIHPPQRRSDGLYLWLRCTECGRTREHFVQHVLVDSYTVKQSGRDETVEYSPYIMDRPITCPKCGTVDRYELTPQAHLALMEIPGPETLANLFMGKKPDQPLEMNPRVHPVSFQAFHRPMHPFAALEEYRRRIASKPGDASLYKGLGNILRNLNRLEEALEIYRQGIEVDPNNLELTTSLAMCAHDLGDEKTARQMYERTIELVTQRGRGRALFSLRSGNRDKELASIASEGLARLRRGQSSPWTPPWELSSTAQPSPPRQPSRRSQPKRSRKKKRRKRRRR